MKPLFFFLLLYSGNVTFAFEGCPDWCREVARSQSKNSGHESVLTQYQDSYDSCMQATKAQGNCGTTANSNTNSSTNTNAVSNQEAQCLQRYQSLSAACDTSYSETSYSCDEKNDSGMTSLADTASQVALMLGQQTASSVQAACGKMADITQAANAAVAAYRLNCGNSISSCRKSCDELVSFMRQNPTCGTNENVNLPSISSEVKKITQQWNAEAKLAEAKEKRNRCDSFNSKISQATQAIQNYGATSANATQCANLTSGDSAALPPAFCQANPTYPGCSQAASTDCNNPQIATTSKICICAKNPTNPACNSGLASSGNNNVGADGNIDSSSRKAGSGASDLDAGDIPGLPSIVQGAMDTSSGQPIDGRQGSGSSLDGDIGGGARGAGGGNRPSDEGSSVSNGGYYGSGGAFSGGVAGNGNGSSTVSNSANAKNISARGPDLRKFLPGGQLDPQRGIAATAKPDGITGPHSDIWRKVQNRYQMMRDTLLP